MRQFRRRKGPLTKSSFLTMSSTAALLAVSFTVSTPVRAADDAAIQKWIAEFQPSTLSKDDQKKELEWFAKAADADEDLVTDAAERLLELDGVVIDDPASADGATETATETATPANGDDRGTEDGAHARPLDGDARPGRVVVFTEPTDPEADGAR